MNLERWSMMLGALGAALGAADPCSGSKPMSLASKLSYPATVADFGGCGGPVPEAEALKAARAAVHGTGIPLVHCNGNVEPGAWGDREHDDTQAIQNAINYVSTDGGVVLFPPGSTYIRGPH
jgi:hypothetical protein